MKTIATFFYTAIFCSITILSFGQINSIDNPTIFNGPFTIVDGNQTMGKVLTSNASGLATWQDAPIAGAWEKISTNNLGLIDDSLNVLVSYDNSGSLLTAKLQVNNSSIVGFNAALRVQVDGSTKLALQNNGGLDIGAYNYAGFAPQNGLYVHGNVLLGTTTAVVGHKLTVDGKIACNEGIRLVSNNTSQYWNLHMNSNDDYMISNNTYNFVKIQKNTGNMVIGSDFVAGCRLSVDGKIACEDFRVKDWNIDNNSMNDLTISRNGQINMKIQNNTGNVAIGNDFAAGHRLSVDGKIACEELLVKWSYNWPDYVFKPDYDLKSLDQVKQYITEKGHLPGVPSAQEVADKGINIGEMNKILMEKVEELTLYILQQEDKMNTQQEMISEQANRLDEQANRLDAIERNR